MEVLWTKTLSTITCLNATLNCCGSGLSQNPPFPLMMEKHFSRQSWFNWFVSRNSNPLLCKSLQRCNRLVMEICQQPIQVTTTFSAVFSFDRNQRQLLRNKKVATPLTEMIFVCVSTVKTTTTFLRHLRSFSSKVWCVYILNQSSQQAESNGTTYFKISKFQIQYGGKQYH